MAVLSRVPKRGKRNKAAGIARGIATIGAGVVQGRRRRREEEAARIEKEKADKLKEEARLLRLEEAERSATRFKQDQADRVAAEAFEDFAGEVLRVKPDAQPEQIKALFSGASFKDTFKDKPLSEEDLLDLEFKRLRNKKMREGPEDETPEAKDTRERLEARILENLEQGGLGVAQFIGEAIEFHLVGENEKIKDERGLFALKNKILGLLAGEQLKEGEISSVSRNPAILRELDRIFLTIPEVRVAIDPALLAELERVEEVDSISGAAPRVSGDPEVQEKLSAIENLPGQ